MWTGHGYFLNDDRASGGRKSEDDVILCTHCERPILKHYWQSQAGAFCFSCFAPICEDCGAKMKASGQCEVHERRFRQAIDDNYRREQNARILGI